MRACIVCGEEVVGRADKVYCSTKCGNKHRNRRYFNKHHETEEWNENQKARNKKYRSTPYGKYVNHKFRARQSGIPFNISFDDWYALWKPYLNLNDGVKYCMCRTGDKGAYEVGNVRIDTAANNNLEARGHYEY